MQKILEKIGCHSNEISPRPLEWISQNEAGITQQSLVRINWNFGTKGKTDFLIAV